MNQGPNYKLRCQACGAIIYADRSYGVPDERCELCGGQLVDWSEHREVVVCQVTGRRVEMLGDVPVCDYFDYNLLEAGQGCRCLLEDGMSCPVVKPPDLIRK
ncbi:MAG: hypothetical protein ACE5JP_01095 [Candidatus Bipolaricaulia bacterium]